MKKTIRVIYEGALDRNLDKLIKKTMEGIGAEWYAQGYNMTSNQRDVCFDLEFLGSNEWTTQYHQTPVDKDKGAAK